MSIVQYAVNAVRGKSYWTPERIVAVLESLWRAAVPSVPMVRDPLAVRQDFLLYMI